MKKMEDQTQLTVLKTSVFFAGDGYSVYDSKGKLIFRVDSYGPDVRDRGEVVLMDPAGKCLITVRKKRPSLHQRWEGFLGERSPVGGGQNLKPFFSVRRSSIIGRSRTRSVTVEMLAEDTGVVGEEYQIDGCFAERCCTFYSAATRKVLAEITRKVDASANVILGKDVFLLGVKPGFDPALAMAFVLILDQINGEDLHPLLLL